MLTENIQILSGPLRGFEEWGATLTDIHNQQTQERGNMAWSCHGEGRHTLQSGGPHANMPYAHPLQMTRLMSDRPPAGRPTQNSMGPSRGRHAGYMHFPLPTHLRLKSPTIPWCNCRCQGHSCRPYRVLLPCAEWHSLLTCWHHWHAGVSGHAWPRMTVHPILQRQMLGKGVWPLTALGGRCSFFWLAGTFT